MPNWCNNDFELELPSEEAQTIFVEAFEERDSPFHVLFKHLGINFDGGLRWDDGEGHPTLGSADVDGWITTAWGPPEELIEKIDELGWLVEWRYYESGNGILGVYRRGGVHEEEEYDDIEAYERIYDSPHPDYEMMWECDAKPGEFVATDEKILGVCVKPGVVLGFDGQQHELGEEGDEWDKPLTDDAVGWFDFDKAKNRTPDVRVSLTTSRDRAQLKRQNS